MGQRAKPTTTRGAIIVTNLSLLQFCSFTPPCLEGFMLVRLFSLTLYGTTTEKTATGYWDVYLPSLWRFFCLCLIGLFISLVATGIGGNLAHFRLVFFFLFYFQIHISDTQWLAG